MGGDHVRQVLEDPEREERAGAVLAEPGRLELALAVAGLDESGSQLGQIDRHQAGAHDDADALGVFAVEVEAGVLDCPGRRRRRRSASPAP